MRTSHDLSALHWKLAGFMPEYWRFLNTTEIGAEARSQVPAVDAPVPGSVQQALLNAGIIPDWNAGFNGRCCEWVEHQHWVYQTTIPAGWLTGEGQYRLRCLGLDYRGVVRLNAEEVATFVGSFVPHVFDLTPHVRKGDDNVLQIIFELPPQWLGQVGYSSKIAQWKPRFYYGWDWTWRLVQAGIWDAVWLDVTDGAEIRTFKCTTDADPAAGKGVLRAGGDVGGEPGCRVRLTLADGDAEIRSGEIPAGRFADEGFTWDDLPVRLWWPNGLGDQPLYSLTCELIAPDGTVVDSRHRTVGFKNVQWRPCDGAPPEADPWICLVNDTPVFLQGVNWTPIRPNFADVREADYRKRLELYRGIGCNVLRVWGGAVLETECFYRLCDQMGLMVWQEFPLSSSGLDNSPPADPAAIEQMAAIAESYVARRQHHVSLLLWCGGNELMSQVDVGDGWALKPEGLDHPMLKRLSDVVAANDPSRRFLPTSPSGPRFVAGKENFGKGIHWDIHGPWKPDAEELSAWSDYWADDDALFRSEVGCPGAGSAELIRRYKGGCDELPATCDNPLWRRSDWWVEGDRFAAAHGRPPADLEEYVRWSQSRQADALAAAARACKGRFPRCGGIIIWMGHDCVPCAANTSIVDFDGNPKTAALALAEIFHTPTDRLQGPKEPGEPGPGNRRI